MMNTKIYYLYRDASNYKVQNVCVIPGVVTREQIQEIIECLDDGEYFIPHLVGLPERKFDTYDTQDDHPFFELSEDGFEPTKETATLELTPAELVEAFRQHKDKWHYIEPERIFELLNILIDEKVNDEGGHGRRVAERLADLGFSKSELLALQFAQGDVDELFEEEDDND